MPQILIFLLYRAALLAGLPLFSLYLLGRGIRDRRYWQRGRERWGFLPRSFQRTAQRSIWLHAVSVGEVLSSIQLIRQIKAKYPEAPVFLSCVTVSGRALADEKLSGLADGIFYLPWDYASNIRRVLRRIRPAVVVVLETEIWPNLYREVKCSGAGLLIINGRISDKAFPTYLKWRRLFQAVLEYPDEILAQSTQDAQRYLRLGAPVGRVHESGNLKYDFDPPGEVPSPIRAWLTETGDGPVWVAASTTGPMQDGEPDENHLVVEAFEQSHTPGLRLILAPRKPETFDTVAAWLTQRGTPFTRRSQLPGSAPILLLDTLGELSSLFPVATLAFVGGTLVTRGGHNILEPALSGAPILVGPHMQNFQEIFQRFQSQNALRVVSPETLSSEAHSLLADSDTRQSLSHQALQAASAERGATERAIAAIGRQLSQVIPQQPRRFITFLHILTPIWRWGAARSRQRLLAQSVRLPVPVISVGNLTTGGTGKTPLVIWLAAWAAKQGYRPAVLTRGYKRSSKDQLILPAGSAAPIEQTGDEAQTILQSGHAALGIGAKRTQNAQALLASRQADLFILDDGFQHAQLERDLDIVLIDALDPFGGGSLLPAGRLREPPSALSRADVILITRAPRSWNPTALEAEICRHNPTAPIHLVETNPIGWHDLATGTPVDPTNQTVAAFCGLANPESFWTTLQSLNIHPVLRRAFPDHHPYQPSDLSTLAGSGATLLLTTHKDAVKLAGFRTPLPIAWLAVSPAIRDEPAFLAELSSRLSPGIQARYR